MDRRHNQELEKNSRIQATKEVIVGLDISTACTAITVLEKDSGKLLVMEPIILNGTKTKGFWDKVTCIKNKFDKIFSENQHWKVVKIGVEENAKRFSPGMSSADTIITLAKFNGIVCYLLFELLGIEPTYVNVRTARSKLNIKIDYKDKRETTKKKVLNIVYQRHPDFPWIIKKDKNGERLTKINEDSADSFVTAEFTRLFSI